MDLDPLDERELDRYQAGIRHGVRIMLEGRPLEDIALELTLLRAAYAQVCAELIKRDRTIRAYQQVIRGG